jgi:hypothetical protein
LDEILDNGFLAICMSFFLAMVDGVRARTCCVRRGRGAIDPSRHALSVVKASAVSFDVASLTDFLEGECRP